MIFVEQDIFEWSDEYTIGVKIIDDAHKQLFTIVGRIIKNFMDNNFEKNKMTCIEAIKYLKNYAIKHFGEEEAYQISIGYPGYKMHKKVHENMRDVVIPALEREVTSQGYSMESMEHFAGACAGWLTAHVLIEDQAIAGKVKSRWQHNPDDDETEMLEDICKTVMNGLLQTPVTLVNKKYQGYELGKLFCYRDEFTDKFGNIYSVTTAVEEDVVEKVVSKIMDKKAFVLSDVMQPMIAEIVKSLNTTVVKAFVSEELENTNSAYMKSSDFYASFEKVYPDYSTLWRTMYGYLAFCIRKKTVMSGKTM